MGGVLTRLLVSSADEELWDWLLHERELDEDREALVRTRLDPIMRFEPFPGVSRTIFIAAPHRGTHVATNRLARWLARLIRLPPEIAGNGTAQAGTLAENWLGADSEQFNAAWQDAANALQQAQDALNTYSQKAITQADQQDAASGGGGGGVGA